MSELEQKIAKLPAWARNYIADLERRTAQAEQDREALRDQDGPTTVVYGDVYGNPRFLPDGPHDHVRFYLTPGSKEHWIDFGRRPNFVGEQVQVHVRSSDSMAVFPLGANTIGVSLVEGAES